MTGIFMRCNILFFCFFLLVPTGYCETLRFLTEPTITTDESGRSLSTESELTRELMRRLNLSGDIEVYPWKRAYAMQQREQGIVLFPTTRTEERENQAKWVGPILKVSWVFYTNKDSNIEINSLRDAMKVDRICGYIGDAKLDFLKKNGFENLIERHRSQDCMDLLAMNKIDLWISTDNAIIPDLESSAYQLSNIKIVYTISSRYLYYALSKDISDETVVLLQDTLDQMKKDGQINKYYNGFYSERVIQETSEIKAPVFPWQTHIVK